MYLTLIISLFVCYAIWVMVKQRKTMKVLDPPALPGQLPLLGHAYLFYGNSERTWHVLKWLSQESLVKGGVVTMNVGPLVTYAISDPDDCLTVANTCLQKDYFYDFAKPWLGNGLFTSSGAHWKRLRKILNPSFNPQVLDGFMDVFNEQARQLVEQLSSQVGGGPFCHLNFICVHTLETVFRTVFGVEDKHYDTKQYLHSVEQIHGLITERFQKFWLHPDVIFNMTRMKAKQDKLIECLHQFSDKVIQDRKLQTQTNSFTIGDRRTEKRGKYKAFLDLLLELSKDEESITDQDIREQVDTFMIAGHDTSAYVLVYTLMTIGSYPEVQDKIYNELMEVIGNSRRDITKHDSKRLLYMEAVIKETIRLYPIGPIISRYIDTEVKLKNYTLPAGSSALLLFWGMHHHAAWGPDAAEFKPERWLNPASLPANPNIFAGFSIGKRNCIGKTFAMMSMKTTLAHLIRHYKVHADISKMKLQVDVMLKPAQGSLISIELRPSSNATDS